METPIPVPPRKQTTSNIPDFHFDEQLKGQFTIKGGFVRHPLRVQKHIGNDNCQKGMPEIWQDDVQQLSSAKQNSLRE